MSRERSVVRLILIALLGVLAIGSSGCLKPAGRAARAVAAKLPANFPADFPIYPKTKVINSDWTMDSQGKMSVRVRWQGPGRVAEALDFYASQLPANGWSHKLDADLQTKVLSLKRQDQNAAALNRLAISPVDESGAREGVFISVEIFLPD